MSLVMSPSPSVETKTGSWGGYTMCIFWGHFSSVGPAGNSWGEEHP